MNTQVKEESLSTDKPSLVTKFAGKYHVDADKMMTTLKATAFKQKEGSTEVSNEQMMALLIVADQYNLNPFTREIYAYPDKNKGIIPVVGVDGWNRIMNSNEEYDGISFVPSIETVTMTSAKECPIAMECTIYRKNRSHPTVITEFLDECYRPQLKTGNYKIDGPWQTHTKRMLRHKAMIQCARVAFSFAGIYDEDEALRIAEGMTFDGEVVSHESKKTKGLNEAILNGGNEKSDLDNIFPSEETNTTNKIDLITRIKSAKEAELSGLQALMLDLEEEDMESCKEEIINRKRELGVDADAKPTTAY